MNSMGLSDECLDSLSWYVNADDEDYYLFIVMAGYCTTWARAASNAKPNHRSKAQKRIDKVKKAFDALTDDDKDFLEVQFVIYDRYIDSSGKGHSGKDDLCCFIDTTINGSFDRVDKKIKSCEKMQWALSQPMLSERSSASRGILLDFAFVAVCYGWVDVSESKVDLTALIKILMKEASVRHDAVAIAIEAVSLAHNKGCS